jgi:hypothetical protein
VRRLLGGALAISVAGSAVVLAPPAHASDGTLSVNGTGVVRVGETVVCEGPPVTSTDPVACAVSGGQGTVTYKAAPAAGYAIDAWDTEGGGPVPCAEAAGGPTWEGASCTVDLSAADPLDLRINFHYDAPETLLGTRPAKLSNDPRPGFSWRVPPTPVPVHVEDSVCTLDGGSIPCASFFAGNGRHTFTVAAVDEEGRKDLSPATYSWTVDTVRPRVKAKSPTGQRVPRAANVSVVFTEAMREATVEARRDGKPLAVYLTLGGRKVAAKATYARSARRLVVNPTRALRPRKVYRVVVTDRGVDLAGNSTVGSSWRFRTHR